MLLKLFWLYYTVSSLPAPKNALILIYYYIRKLKQKVQVYKYSTKAFVHQSTAQAGTL